MTKIALITTTIHIPVVLEQYGRIGPDVDIYIASDLKTPHHQAQGIGSKISNDVYYLSPQDQIELAPALSDIIGWNTIQRRNLALLAALRSGADLIFSVDDDIWPLEDNFFDRLLQSFQGRAFQCVTANGFINPGADARPSPYVYRGFPYRLRHEASCAIAGLVDASPVGIVNGLLVGDPDIDAVERIVNFPTVEGYDMAENTGLLVDPCRGWSPINSGSTAYIRDLAPLAFVLPGVGRYDDIWASYIAQRVMMATPYRVLFGQPLARHERHPHNLVRDVRDELYGMEWTETFCELLRAAPVREGASVIDNLASIADYLSQSAPAEMKLSVPLSFLYQWCEEVSR